jgi:hypothetical protein
LNDERNEPIYDREIDVGIPSLPEIAEITESGHEPMVDIGTS